MKKTLTLILALAFAFGAAGTAAAKIKAPRAPAKDPALEYQKVLVWLESLEKRVAKSAEELAASGKDTEKAADHIQRARASLLLARKQTAGTPVTAAKPVLSTAHAALDSAVKELKQLQDEPVTAE